MDLPQHDDLFSRMEVSINGRSKVIDDVGFFGVSGGPISPLNTPYEIPEEEIARRAHAGFAGVKKCRRRIFVPHMPPFGTKVDIIHSGIHVGSSAIRDFIEDHKPDLVICGHIHEARGRDMIDETIIVNCGPASHGRYVLIDVGATIDVVLK
jgi:Icc-related predicted phosphoesterase